MNPRRHSAMPRRQRGMGMLELLIVMLISLFMLAGMFSIVYGTRQNFLAQNQLSTLQDNERMAMNLLTNVIQTGGYFPNPTASTAVLMLPASGVFANSGQSVYGVTSAGGDQISVRYVAGTADGVADCTGQTNATAAAVTLINVFYVNNNQLYCQVTSNGVQGAAFPLVSGVTAMTIAYGVDTNGDGSADEYLTAAAMNAANWNAVVSVQVQLTFANPLAGTAGNVTGPATINLSRNIDLLNRI